MFYRAQLDGICLFVNPYLLVSSISFTSREKIDDNFENV